MFCVMFDIGVQICDLGLARGVKDDADYDLTEYVVTRWYRAPEVMCSCQEYDRKSMLIFMCLWFFVCSESNDVNTSPVCMCVQLMCGLLVAYWRSYMGSGHCFLATIVCI